VVEREFCLEAAQLTYPGFRRRVVQHGSVSGSARKKREIVERDISNITVDARVVHRSFGSGVVRAIQDEIAEIEFDDGKVMKFMLKYTPIEIEET
jgi:hypothetical protein